MRRILIASLLVLLCVGCGDDPEPATPPPTKPDGYRIQGRVLDAETGELYSRQTVHIHAFNDDRDHQVSLDPAKRYTYRVDMPGPVVRLRVFDASQRHLLFETTLTLEEPVTKFDVRLEPTHYIRLHGRLLREETGEALVVTASEGTIGGQPLLYLEDVDGEVGRGPIWPDEGGRYSERVPRSRIRFSIVNTAGHLVEPEVDLRGSDGDAYEFDLRLSGHADLSTEAEADEGEDR